jgi:hypothetical protein
VVFPGLPVGTYTATVNQAGYVGLANLQAVTKSALGVNADTVTRAQVSYDLARTMPVQLDPPVTGAVVPPGLTLRYSGGSVTAETTMSSACPTTGNPTAPCGSAPTSAGDGKLAGVFPTIYTVKLGTCTETAPSAVQKDVTLAANDNTPAVVPMGAITVNYFTLIPSSPVARPITISHTSGNAGCTAGEQYVIPASGTGTTFLVPYGAWNVAVPKAGATGTTDSTVTPITVSPTSRTGVATLLVTS